MEWSIFAVWFPGLKQDQSQQLEDIETFVSRGGMQLPWLHIPIGDF
jgi:hypothetical protein